MPIRCLMMISCLMTGACSAADRSAPPQKIGSALQISFDHAPSDQGLERITATLVSLVEGTEPTFTLRVREPGVLLDETGAPLDELPRWTAPELEANQAQTLTAYVRLKEGDELTFIAAASLSRPDGDLREIEALRLPEREPDLDPDGNPPPAGVEIKEHPATLRVR
jgi:hypothetical protein